VNYNVKRNEVVGVEIRVGGWDELGEVARSTEQDWEMCPKDVEGYTHGWEGLQDHNKSCVVQCQMFKRNPSWNGRCPSLNFRFCFCCVCCVDNIVGCSPPWDVRWLAGIYTARKAGHDNVLSRVPHKSLPTQDGWFSSLIVRKKHNGFLLGKDFCDTPHISICLALRLAE